MKLLTLIDSLPTQAKAVFTGASVTGAWATYLGLVQDAFGAGAAILSFVWLALQIYSFWEKRRK
ncbi:MAG: hypothetical protein MN733_37600 [Nitrososphaera sp.]|nr:hypothetical protein [Nitrososphaera sp.]